MAKALANIKSLARGHTATAIRTLAGIMQQTDAPAAARVAAATALLDRGWGKPQQDIGITPSDAFLDAMRQINAIRTAIVTDDAEPAQVAH